MFVQNCGKLHNLDVLIDSLLTISIIPASLGERLGMLITITNKNEGKQIKKIVLTKNLIFST